MNLDIAGLIQHYGYLAVAIGCLLEGETVLLLAGFAAHRGHLDLPLVIAIAAVAGFTSDQIFFWIGRRHAGRVLARFPRIARESDQVFRLLERWQAWVIVGVRFAYGLRVAGPILIGGAGIRPLTFALFDGLGAALWATSIAIAGYLFGHAIEKLLGQVRNLEAWILGAVVLGGLAYWGWRRRSRQ